LEEKIVTHRKREKNQKAAYSEMEIEELYQIHRAKGQVPKRKRYLGEKRRSEVEVRCVYFQMIFIFGFAFNKNPVSG